MGRQGELIATLAKRAKEIRMSKDPRPKKIEKLRAFLSDSKNNLNSMPPLPLPLNATIEVTGIIPEKILRIQVEPLPSPPLLFLLRRLRVSSHLQGW